MNVFNLPPAFAAWALALLFSLVPPIAFAHGDDGSSGAIAGTERELPVGQVRIEQPLMRAGVDRQLGAGTDRADLGRNEYLILGRIEEVHFANVGGECFRDDGLSCFHGKIDH